MLHQAQSSAAQNSKITVATIVQRIGDGGGSTISSAAGKNASPPPRLLCVRRSRTMRRIGLAGLDELIISAVTDATKHRGPPS
jgi:hypothetical protein